MFKLSRGAEYAIRGLLYLAMQPEGKISFIEEISIAQTIPRAYLAKIFQTLGKKGFVKSYRGPDGGFALTKPADEISLLDAIETIEGPIHFNECLIHEGHCHKDEICPVHNVWMKAQKQFMEVLTETNFTVLAEASRAKAQRKADTAQVLGQEHL